VQNDPKVNLCVEVARTQPSGARGQAAQWLINVWTTGGNVPDAIIRLQPTPTTGKAVFSFGCGTYDGTASCDLGAMDAKSRARQLQATLTVPAGETGVQAETLTVIGSAAKLPHDPTASSTVTLTAPVTPVDPDLVTSPLAVGRLPDIPTPSPTLSPGGNAAGLFPTLQPTASRSAAARKANVKKLAETSALPEGAPVIGAQLVGLGALALAFVLAVTRLSIRRRPNAPPPAATGPNDAASPQADEPQPIPKEPPASGD
jgi:hypothetical protein